jgi:hypothetical protein
LSAFELSRHPNPPPPSSLPSPACGGGQGGGNAPLRWLAIAFIAVLPAACAVIEPPPPPNPFAGAWTTTERRQIAFRDNTVVLNPPNQPPTPLGAETCAGQFRFSYGRKSRDALVALTPRQADLQRRLAAQLVQPEYPVAELSCGEGGTTYVLLSERDLLAIHRDRDIAGLQRLTR